jgi:hypothetical protein
MLFRIQTLFLFCFIFRGLLSTTGYAMEQDFEVRTTWNSSKNVCIPCDIDGSKNLVYSVRTINLNLKGRHFFDYEVLNPVYEVISIPAYYSAEQLPSQSDIVVEFSKSQGDNFVVTNFKPIIYVNGEVRFLKSFTIHVTSSPNYTATTRTTSFAASSVLATGTWYKVGVSATGLHKIDAAFLTSLGVTISGLNPATHQYLWQSLSKIAN